MALSLGTAWVQVSPTFKDFKKQVERETRDIPTKPAERAFGDAFKRIASTGGQAFKAVGKAGATTIAGLGAAVAGLAIKGGISRALNIEEAQAKLKGLGHDAASVTSIMNSALESVKGTQYGLGDAATVAASLSASGIASGEALTQALKTVADTAQISGRSMAEVGSIFGKVAATGKLQGDELMQLSDAGIPVLQLLGKSLGKTSAEISDMSRAGAINFEMLETAMRQGMGGAALEGSKTLSGAMANARAALSRLGEAVSVPILDGLRRTFVALIPLVDATTNRLKPLVQALGERFGRVIERVTTGIESFVEKVKTASVPLDGIKGALVGLTPVFMAMGGALGGMLADLPLIGKLFAGMSGPVGAFVGVMVVMVTKSSALREALGGAFRALADAVGAFAPAVMGVLTRVGEAMATLGDAVAPVIKTLASGISTAVSEIAPVVQTVAGVIGTVLVGALRVAVPVIRAVMGWLTKVGEWCSRNRDIVISIMAGVAAGWATFKAAQMVSGVARFAKGLLALGNPMKLASAGFALMTGSLQALKVAFLTNPFGLVAMAVIGLGAGLVVLWKRCEGFRNFVKGMWAGIKSGTAAAVSWLRGALSAIGGFFVSVWNGIKTATSAAMSWLKAYVVPVFQFIWNNIVTGFKIAWAIIRPILIVIAAVIGVVILTIKGIIMGLIWFVRNVLAPVFSWLYQNIIAPVWDGIKAYIGFVVAGVLAVVGGIVWFWQNVLAPVFSWLYQNIIVPVWDGIKAYIGFIVAGVLAVVGGIVWFWQNVLAPVFTWLYQNIVMPVWTGIKAVIGAVVGWIRDVVVPIIKTVVNAIAAAFQWVSDKIGAAWGWIKDRIIGPVVDWFKATVVPAFEHVRDRIVRAFEVMRDGIKTAWNAIKELAAVPVRFVVNTVAAGLVKAYNWVATKFGADAAEVPHVDFARGGFAGREAGFANRAITWAEAGPEAYIPLSPAKRARSLSIWQETGRRLGVDGMGSHHSFYADGGITDGKASPFNVIGDVVSWIGDKARAAVDFLKSPIEWLKGKVAGLIEGVGKSPFAQMIASMPRKLAETIGDWVKEHLIPKVNAASGSAAFDGWWEQAIAVNPDMIPYKNIAAVVAEKESGFNPTIQNNWDSNAMAGTPSAGLMQFIEPTFRAYQWPGFGNWLGPVDQLLAWWRYVWARYGGPHNIPGIRSMASGGGYVGYANGTLNADAGLHWVGEAGPELINFRGGETVRNQSQIGTEVYTAVRDGLANTTLRLSVNGHEFNAYVSDVVADTVLSAARGR